MPAFDADAIRSRHALADVARRYGVALKADGREWKACCPFHSEDTPSFTIYHAGGGVDRFYCFGCASHGDVIDFVQEWDKVGFREACESLDGPSSELKPPPVSRTNGHSVASAYDGWIPGPPPENAPLLIPGVLTREIANPKRGYPAKYTPSAVYPYLSASGDLVGYVLRVELGDGRKITPSVVWMMSPEGIAGWSHGPMAEPRPIYGLSDLLAYPGRQVLIVEGEKCRDAGAEALADKMVVVSWCGGAQAAGRTDWTALAGRRCVLWPDADVEGREAMNALACQLASLGATVRVLEIEDDRPKGWDIADAIDDGWDAGRLIEYAKARARDWTGPTESEVMPSARGERPRIQKTAATRPHQPPPVDGATALAPDLGQLPTTQTRKEVGNVVLLHGGTLPTGDDLDDYRSHLIADEHGKVKSKLANNYFWMLRGHPQTRGLFAWNIIADCVFVMARPPWVLSGEDKWQPRPLYDDDIFRAGTWLENQGLTPRKPDARDAIKSIAHLTRYNPVVDYLTGLVWDGCPRLQGGSWEGDTVPPLSTEYLGTPEEPIYGVLVTKWHIGAVARAMRPGCKADCMVIFESPQGKFKSTYLRKMATIDGHEYFADNVGDITSAGSIMLLQGTWIIEVAELSGFDRREVNSIKAWLSRTTDRYVPKYESEKRDVPRNFLVAGTHNPSGHGYLKDPTGARRFWPVPVTEVDINRVERDRDQIWAEAMTLYRANVKWWLSDEENAAVDALTQERQVEDPWSAKIDEITKGLPTVTLASVARGLEIPMPQQNELTTKRISEHLKNAGFAQGRDKSWRRGIVQQGEML